MSDTLARLKRAEMKRQSAIAAHRQAKQEVARLILLAREEGIPMTQVAESSGINRPNLYLLIEAAAGKED